MTGTDEPAAKRPRPTVGSALKTAAPPGPDFDKGVEYWDNVDASVDGVLGGFGTGPVPHIEQLSSRLLLLSLIPSLATFSNPLTPSPLPPPRHRRTVLDVGAGIGRVTSTVLLPLFDDVILTEPVDKFITSAYTAASAGEWRDLPVYHPGRKVRDEEESREMKRRVEESNEEGKRGKRVWFVKTGLQGLDPRWPGKKGKSLGVVGVSRDGEGELGGEEEVLYDVIWCQWCLGHMTHTDLVAFLRRAKAALRPDNGGMIFVKENLCDDGPNGEPVEFLDEEDSSLTRSNGMWLKSFQDAGLELVKEEVQQGMPSELFVVKTYALC